MVGSSLEQIEVGPRMGINCAAELELVAYTFLWGSLGSIACEHRDKLEQGGGFGECHRSVRSRVIISVG